MEMVNVGLTIAVETMCGIIKMSKINRLDIKPVMAATLALAFVSACETTGETYGSVAGTRSALYAPGDRLYQSNHLETIHASNVTPEESRQRELAAFSGIEGARLAHRLYTAHAEELDGSCESKITVGQGETLWDIAELCDVSIFTLTDGNPHLGDNHHIFDGQEINIPHTNTLNPQGLLKIGYGEGVDDLPLSPFLQPPSIYHVQDGDTLQSIAARHNVSAAAIANLNPGINWKIAPVGAALKLPAKPVVKAKPSQQSIVTDRAEREVSNHLQVNISSGRPGEKVRLAARGLRPLELVTIYRGANRRSLKPVGEFRTNDLGELYAEAAIAGNADLGGVIFAAAMRGDYLYSPRVGVEKIRN